MQNKPSQGMLRPHAPSQQVIPVLAVATMVPCCGHEMTKCAGHKHHRTRRGVQQRGVVAQGAEEEPSDGVHHQPAHTTRTPRTPRTHTRTTK